VRARVASVTSSESHTNELQEYIRLLRARKWEISLVALVVVVTALFITIRQTPIYEGQAKVLVNSLLNPQAPGGFSQAPNLDTERQIALSEAVVLRVKDSLHLTTLPGGLAVDPLTDTSVLLFRFDSPVPATAQRMANAFAREYVDFRRHQTLDQFVAAEQAVQRHIATLHEQLGSINRKLNLAKNPAVESSLQTQRDTIVAQLVGLNQQLSNLQSSEVAQNPSQLLESASLPSSPVRPNKIKNGVLALFVGLVLGVGLAFLRERLDDRIKSRQEIERRLGVPVVAAVPKVSGWRRAEEARLMMVTDPKNPVSEAYRTLGTNIQYIASQRPLKVLMVTSALGGEGKTTTSANLAVVLAKAGKRVVLISADLRKPRIHQFFGLPNRIGLSSVLSDSGSLRNVTQDPGVENLRVLAGGPVPPDPAELLGSNRALRLIESLRAVSDYIVIDTPPVLAVADASILAPLVDGTVFVMDAEHSSRSAMLHAKAQLENAGAKLIGAVYNNFDPTQSAGYASYYYYQYYETPEEGSSNGAGKKPRSQRIRSSRTKSEAPGFGVGVNPKTAEKS
jgi:succinoglycan biosynthesis transport protein ExoP